MFVAADKPPLLGRACQIHSPVDDHTLVAKERTAREERILKRLGQRARDQWYQVIDGNTEEREAGPRGDPREKCATTNQPIGKQASRACEFVKRVASNPCLRGSRLEGEGIPTEDGTFSQNPGKETRVKKNSHIMYQMPILVQIRQRAVK